MRQDNEINPDVLGYIFEKYINQKQMGAYYTKEDITEYISKNTIIPFLFDAAAQECAVAFQPDGAVWALLKENPNRYIYAAVSKGVDAPLPADIEAGIEAVAQRDGWNRPATAEYALPTETWREHVARCQRCLDLRAKLAHGEVTSINDLITHILHQNISTRFRSRLIPRQDPARAESLASDRFLLKVNSLRSVALTVEVPAQIPVSTQAEGLRLRINRPSG